MTVGIVTIATGTYSSFVAPLAESIRQNGAADRLFVLTDNSELLEGNGARDVIALPFGALPWPYPTLLRYQGINSYGDVFRSEVDHLIYSDADMRIVGPCDELIGEGVFAVRHPGFRMASSQSFPHESRPESRAYVAAADRSVYVCGGVQGGQVDHYLAAVGECAAAITSDFRAGIVAKWHDESHWNRWVSENLETVIHDSQFCWPESWSRPVDIDPRILALDKDHHALRGTRPNAREVASRMKGRIRAAATRARSSMERSVS